MHAWIDLDDRLEGAEHMGTVAERFAKCSRLGVVIAQYRLPNGDAAPVERFVRAPVRWVHPTYERIVQRLEVASTSAVRWLHTGDSQHGRRDLDIALRWAEKAPQDWRPWFAAAKEAMFPLRDTELVMRYARRALELARTGGMPSWPHSFLYELMMLAAIDQKDAELAEIFARRAAATCRAPRPCLFLARESLRRGEYDETEDWAAEAKRAAPDNRLVTELAERLAAVAVKRRREVVSAMINSRVPLPAMLPAIFGA